MTTVGRSLIAGIVLLAGSALASHDDEVGARFVHNDGANASDCLDHDVPCESIQYALAQAEPGNTVRVAAGIYDMSGVDPESFLFGTTKAAGGYAEVDHFGTQDPDTNRTILVGVDARYRQPMARQGFKWAADAASAAAGLIDNSVAPALQATQVAATSCVQGFAGQFPCRNVDFEAQIPLNQFSTVPASAANVWGFVDLNDLREYAVIGLRNGTAVVDVTDPAAPREVTTVPGNASAWREVKIYQYHDTFANRYRAYAYVATEAPGSGVQVIDLSGLPASAALGTTIMDTSSQHTVYVSNIDYATNVALPGRQAFLYVAGSKPGAGGWRAYGLQNPASPQFVTAPPGAQYMHDSTSLYITDNRTTQCEQGHNPCDVLVDFNEDSVDLWDVTNKALPALLSSTTYPNVRYTHSGWPSADQRFLFIHDELEEIQLGLRTSLYTMNLDDLRTPSILASYQGSTTTTDHNGYTKGNFYYVSHYRRGLVIFDVTNPNNLRELGMFDTFLAPVANSAGTDGAWGVYPFLPSGTILISDITNGLFVLKDNTVTLSQSAGRVGFTVGELTVAENASLATVRVQRSGGLAGAVSVQYASADVTLSAIRPAAAGSDYTLVSGTLTWAAGDLDEKTFTVPLVNDGLDEGDEVFQVALSAPSGGATIDGSTTLHIVIGNDDAPVAPPAGGGGGGGGGGAVDLGLLALLALAASLQTRRRRLRRWFVPLFVLFTPLAASAHHSVAFYSNDRIELAGEITRIDWQNPHIQFGLKTVGPEGAEKIWKLESSSIFLREKDGVTRDLFQVGDKVKVAGRPSAHDAAALLVTNMLLPDGREAPMWPNTSARFVGADKWITATPELVDAAKENRGIFRVWRPNEVSLAALPYTDAAVAARKSFDMLAAAARCGPEGLPRIMITLFPYEFVDRGNEILVRVELYDTVRTIHTDRKTPPTGEPRSVLGYSVGEWRDGALVIETSLMNWPYFDQIGTPLTDQVKVTERYKVSDDQTRLDVEITVVDPFTFKQPAIVKNTWLAYGDTLARYDCKAAPAPK